MSRFQNYSFGNILQIAKQKNACPYLCLVDEGTLSRQVVEITKDLQQFNTE
jgi:hypothetical protein